MRKKDYIENKNDNLKWIDKSDYQIAKSIIKRADTKNIRELGKLYYIVKNGKIAIHSNRTRVAMTLYLADAIVERIMKKKRSPIKTTIGILCILTAVLLAVVTHFSNENTKNLENMTQNLHQMHNVSVMPEDSEDVLVDETETEIETETEKELLPEMKELYSANEDLFGWICIEGTEIDYPIVQSADNKYYLSRNFYKEEDAAGTLFVDYRNTDVLDTNLIIYGHNMRNGKMFGTLDEYEDYEFFQQHSEISFETLYEKYAYKIIAVCKGKVAYEDEEGFRYYNFINASADEDLQAFWDNIVEHSLFDVSYEFSEDDNYLTLSTCNNFTENGRLYIVAVKEVLNEKK